MTDSPDVEATAKQPLSAGEWWQQFLVRRTVAISLLLALVTVLSWGARWHWSLDLLSHFPVQIAVTAVVLLGILLAFRKWKAAIVPAIVLGVCVAQLVPLYLPVKQPSYSGKVIHAISANILRSNQKFGSFIEYIQTKRPDFVLVMEVDELWLAELEALHEEYPHQISQPGHGAFGIALYSRVPIDHWEIVTSATAGVPMILATLDFGNRQLNFVGVHPLPPVKSGTQKLRNGQLEEIAALTAPLATPKMILGDLNITSWSPYFGDLLERAGVRDGRKGFGIQPSWPALPGIARIAEIPIDHTLVSDDVEVVARRIGPNIGSDHRPVEIDFRIDDR